jgi:hypothetical protein
MFGGSKTIKFVFAIAIVSLLSISSCTATGVSLELSSQVVSQGDTFTVDVFVEPDVAIAGMQFDLDFDDTKMHVDDVTEGDLFTQSGMNTYFKAGAIDFGSLSNVYGTILGAANVVTPSAFATITMVVDAQDAGTSTINLKNVVISDPEGHAVEIEVINTSVEIASNHDVNGDGIINFADYEIVVDHFSENTSSPYPDWDVNSDGAVNILDLTLVASNLD